MPDRSTDIAERFARFLTVISTTYLLVRISMGLLAEMQARTYHESQGKPIYVVRESLEPSC